MNLKIKTPTQQLISEVEARMRAQFSGNPTALVASLEQLILAGGKRIRPTITLLTGKIFGLERETLINLAAAIEMLHTATLIHDDLVDRADQRRGHTTINTAFTTSATVLAGDLAFAASARLAAATNNITVMEKFSETLQFIVNGEITYMFRNGDSGDREAYYYRWIHAKTASVFEVAAGIPAAISCANEAEISAAYQFGYNLGMAFQIADDVLDFTGDPTVLGKPVGNDLRQGTLTLPAILYLDVHPNDLDLLAIIKRNGHTPETLDRLITAIRQSQAIDQALEVAHSFLQQGLEALAGLPDTPERAELEHLADQLVNRKM